ncbi:hypothetical protein F7725_003527 [Dissostichus mawsoni]|uniref:Uncharacterized protein n=1 Tax=Dissostichus mawsoni TaxID=36200 RepID=A0A7J5YCG3_DISMA|nr:hypothetical protein F7725_003527 [Dissostichus mawsoni]
MLNQAATHFLLVGPLEALGLETPPSPPSPPGALPEQEAGGLLLLLFSTAPLGTKPSDCLKMGISGFLEASSTGLVIGDWSSTLL